MDFLEKSSSIPGYLIQGMTKPFIQFLQAFVGSYIHVSTIKTGSVTKSHHFPK